MTPRAFTLTEILVCCAILAILAGVLLAVLPRARESGKSTTCIANFVTIWRGTSLYAVNNDELFPPYAFQDYGRFAKNQPAFIEAVKTSGVPRNAFFCPSDPHRESDFEGEFYSFRNTSYFMGWRVYFAAKLGEQGAMLFAPFDSPMPETLLVFTDQPWLTETKAGKSKRETAHGRRTNSIYADGHIKNESVEQP